jgi:hypothetical protein
MNIFGPAELLVNHVFTLVENSIYSTKLEKNASLKAPLEKKDSSELGKTL